tara:strand:+ start:4185 stop:5141 length:957 start_codon:yes stop_codon:yes gene_type:complete
MKINKLYFFYGDNVRDSPIKTNTMQSLQKGAEVLGIPTEKVIQHGSSLMLKQKKDYDFISKNEYAVQLAYLPQRDRAIEQKFKQNVFFVDRNIMQDYQKDLSNKRYYRISSGSIYYELSKKNNVPNDILKTKQKNFYEDFNINLNKKQTEGKNILILFNKPDGFGTKDIHGRAINWGFKKIKELRSAGFQNRIDMKFHPATHGEVKKEAVVKAKDAFGNVCLLNGKFIYDTFKKDEYLCAITYNSSAIIPCFLEGIPIWVDCPTNILYKYSHIKKISDINNLHININNRQQFLNECIECLWSVEDMKKGLVWKAYLQT